MAIDKGTKKVSAKKTDKAEFEPFDWASLAPHPIVGLDEVGRGCLAGPVYAAAAIVPLDCVERLQKLGVTDSKLLSSSKRDDLALEIQACCQVAVGFATSEEIDQINILQASFLAMRRALIALEMKHFESESGFESAHFIVDGHQRIPMLGQGLAHEKDLASRPRFERYAKIQQTTIIKGDLRALPIAAASIVAKVTRDRLMIEAALEYPQYGFEKHKGYAAPIHRKAIEEHGPTQLHRKTFGGVREFLDRVAKF